MPGLFAGGTIVFIFAFTELGVPLIFDYSRVTSVQIFYGIKEIARKSVPVRAGGRDARRHGAALRREQASLRPRTTTR